MIRIPRHSGLSNNVKLLEARNEKPHGAGGAFGARVYGPHRTWFDFGIALGRDAEPVPVAPSGALNAVGNGAAAFVYTDNVLVRDGRGKIGVASHICTRAQYRESSHMSVEIEERKGFSRYEGIDPSVAGVEAELRHRGPGQWRCLQDALENVEREVKRQWRKPAFSIGRWPRLARAALAAGGALVVLVGLANAYVLLSERGESTDSVADVPHVEVAIVPGALVKPNGRMSPMLADRVRQAAALWRSGKVEKVLVSGDHRTWAYDEPDTMRKALVRAGVAPRDVFEDHAGFDTWATMVRARAIFGVRDAVVVTQGFHMPRALFLADAAGIDATGLTADLHPWGFQGRKSKVREVLSRVKAVADAALDTPAMAGPPIPISGDGRASWGPPPPPGTPPAGSPGR